jgi:hypothetical protein
LGLKASIDWGNWYIPEVKAVMEGEVAQLRQEAESGWSESHKIC